MEIYHDENDRRKKVIPSERDENDTGDASPWLDRRVHETAKLGTAERWILGIAGSLFTLAIIWVGSSLLALTTSVAVANSQLSAIRNQLNSVPKNTNDIAQLQVQVRRNQSDIHDLQQIKEVK